MPNNSNKIGPKVGKWKRWAQDGDRTKAEIDSEVKLVKRIIGGDDSIPDSKFLKDNEGNLSVSNGKSAGRSSPACRSQ